MKIEARGKINWTLAITGKREDGYHLMDMLLQSVSLCDYIEVQPSEALALRTSQGARVPATEDNLVMKAALALQRATGYQGGADIYLEKHIPIGAGMGGGSADAAAVLVGLNKLWSLSLTDEALMAIALTIGADVPFCIKGGLQRAQGIGEVLTPLPCKQQFWLLIIQPCRGLSTKTVFADFRLDRVAASDYPDNDKAQEALERGDVPLLLCSMGNVLQPVSEALRPEIHQAIISLRNYGAKASMMTGSGSAVYGVFLSAQQCRDAKKALSLKWPICHMTYTCLEGLVIRE